MTALYILLGIIAFFFILFFSSVSVKCNISDEINVELRYLFFNKTIYQIPKKKQKVPQKNTDEDVNKNIGKLRQMIDEKGLLSTINELLEIVKVIFSKLGKAVSHIRVKHCYLTVNVASPDPAKTAVEYGAVCSVIYPVISGFQEFLKWKQNNTVISVNSDFCSDRPTVFVDFKIKLRLWFIVKFGFGVLLNLVKYKVKDTLNKQKPKV